MTVSRREFIGAAATGPWLLGTPGHRIPPSPSQGGFDPWLEISPAALEHNVGEVTRLSRRPILAVLKNNAYGLGIPEAGRLLEAMPQIAGFAVVRSSEAVGLRDAGVRKPVLLMARAGEGEVPDLLARGITLSVYAADDPRRLAPFADRFGPLAVQVYVDTGMSRMGVPSGSAPVFLEALRATGAFRVAGTYMAFTEDPEFDLEQLRRFRGLIGEAGRRGLPVGQLHAASSNGVFHLPDAHLDLVRPGIALYGGYPSRPAEERALATLRPAVRLAARVVRVQRLEAGEGVSYGRNYVAGRPVWIATLPVGHADGYPREAVRGARVLIGERTYPVIGAVSASHTIVEVGDEPSVRIGDRAVLLGPDHAEVHPNTVAERVGVSVYDLFMHLNPGLPRLVV